MQEDLLPLNRRVQAPSTVDAPTHPSVHEWRPARAEDVEAILAFERVVAASDHPNWVTSRDEVMELFSVPHIDPAVDSMLALDDDGSVLAFGTVVVPPGQETLVRCFVLGNVLPTARERGIGSALVGWQQARAEQHLASSDKRLPGWIISFAEERASGAADLLEQHGLALTRHFFSVERVVADPIREVEVDDAIEIVQYTSEMAEATRLARNDAFQDHWSSQSTSVESWAHFVDGEAFDAELSFLALTRSEAGREVVGFLLTLVNRDDWEGQGFTGCYVDLVGVVRGWRGRRIAQALLARHLHAARAAGLQRSTLDVDSENPSGALGLYTGMGFTVAHRHMSFVRVV